MLTHLRYFAIAIFYKKRNPKLGLKILLEKWSQDEFPDDFWNWWMENNQQLSDQWDYFSSKWIKFTYPGNWDYPEAFLKHLDTTPLLISYIGHPSWSKNFNLGVVGSRKINSLTRDWINEELYSFLSLNQVSIISGGARGVDQSAHLCALRSKQPTFVFLPSGLEKIYPSGLSDWQDEILNCGGAFISEYWPTEEIKKHYFIERNRLIASLSDFVLVAQGELRSGTMLTAKWALELGRDLGVIPGHPKDSSFSGNLDLIRSGIQPIIDSQDLSFQISRFKKNEIV